MCYVNEEFLFLCSELCLTLPCLCREQVLKLNRFSRLAEDKPSWYRCPRLVGQTSFWVQDDIFQRQSRLPWAVEAWLHPARWGKPYSSSQISWCWLLTESPRWDLLLLAPLRSPTFLREHPCLPFWAHQVADRQLTVREITLLMF